MKRSLKRRAMKHFRSESHSPSATTPYQYEALEAGQFRILTLLPGSRKSPVCCTLQTVQQDNLTTPFVALSWTWGSEPSKTATITLDGRVHIVRKSLHEALKALRFAVEPRILWIDAVCINQNDDTEKASQIPLMASIYTLADHVLVWLGVPADDSEYVMEVLRHDRDHEFATTRFTKGLVQFVRRPWFNRIWIIQEFVLNPSSPQIACGSGPAVDYILLQKAWMAVYDSFTPLNTNLSFLFTRAALTNNVAVFNGLHVDAFGDGSTGIMDVQRLRQQFQHGGGFDLGPTLDLAANSRSSDARDRVYGILGLLDANVRARFLTEYPLNYAKSAAEVYHDVTVFLLTQESMPLFLLNHFRFRRRTNATIPSWALDLAARPNPYSIVGGEDENDTFKAIVSSDGQVLTTYGLVLDQINHTVAFNLRIETVRVPKLMKLYGCTGYALSLLLALCMRTPFPHPMLAKLTAQTACHAREFASGFRRVHCLIEEKFGDAELSEPLWKTLNGGGELQESPSVDKIEELVVSLLLIGSLKSGLLSNLLAGSLLLNVLYWSLGLYLPNRSFFTCAGRWYGVAEGELKHGDQLVLLFPPSFHAFILRPSADKYEMVSLAYVPTAMRRDAVSRAEGNLVEFNIL